MTDDAAVCAKYRIRVVTAVEVGPYHAPRAVFAVEQGSAGPFGGVIWACHSTHADRQDAIDAAVRWARAIEQAGRVVFP